MYDTRSAIGQLHSIKIIFIPRKKPVRRLKMQTVNQKKAFSNCKPKTILASRGYLAVFLCAAQRVNDDCTGARQLTAVNSARMQQHTHCSAASVPAPSLQLPAWTVGGSSRSWDADAVPSSTKAWSSQLFISIWKVEKYMETTPFSPLLQKKTETS